MYLPCNIRLPRPRTRRCDVQTAWSLQSKWTSNRLRSATSPGRRPLQSSGSFCRRGTSVRHSSPCSRSTRHRYVVLPYGNRHPLRPCLRPLRCCCSCALTSRLRRAPGQRVDLRLLAPNSQVIAFRLKAHVGQLTRLAWCHSRRTLVQCSALIVKHASRLLHPGGPPLTRVLCIVLHCRAGYQHTMA